MWIGFLYQLVINKLLERIDSTYFITPLFIIPQLSGSLVTIYNTIYNTAFIANNKIMKINRIAIIERSCD